jgi:hypothetical protein
MKKNNKVVTYMRSVSFALIIAIISMLVQSPHSYTAFHDLSSLRNTGWGIAQAVVFALVIDLAVLFYTLRKRTDIAIGAAVAMGLINIYYYWVEWQLSLNFAFGCFLSLLVPVSVYFYSEEIELPDDESILYPDPMGKINELRRTIDNQIDQYNKVVTERDTLKVQLNSFRESVNGISNETEVDRSLLNIQKP